VVVEALGGPVESARFMTGTGGEKIPEGIDPKTVMVERSVPLETMREALLAWEMNGEPLSLAHGGPLRLIVPGYYGVNSVKYIRRLAFTAVETDAAIQTTGYRLRPIGQKGDPSQPSMWKMNVKSWIEQPADAGETIRSGMVQVAGVAFSGGDPVKQVEVSADGGKTWKAAHFIGPDLGRYAWRDFVLPVELAPGTHVLASRATDAAGNTQPEQRMENERGYGHNGWRDAAIKVTVA
jgi:sulfite dehydrogenase